MGAVTLRSMTIMALAMLCCGWLSGLPTPAQAANSEDFCRDAAATRLVLIDVTSGMDDWSKDNLQSGLTVIYRRLKAGERVILRTIDADYTKARTLFDRCLPHCEEAGFFDNCTEGSLRLERVKFSKALAKAFDGITSEPEQSGSDILRSLHSSVVSLGHSDRTLDVYIFSDMIENSALITGRQLLNQSPAALAARAEKAELSFDCKNISIAAVGIGRQDAGDRSALGTKQMNRLKAFWNTYFGQQGCSEISLLQRLE